MKRVNIVATICLIGAITAFAHPAFRENSPLARNLTGLIVAQLLFTIGISLSTPAFLKGFIPLLDPFLSAAFGVCGTLATRNLRKNIPRNAVAVAAVFLGMSLFVSTSGLVKSVKDSVTTWVDTVNRADIFVTAGHPMSSANAPVVPLPAALGPALESIPGILSADPWRKITLDYNGSRVLLSSIDFNRRAEYSTVPSITRSDREKLLPLLPNQDNAVVSESFAALFGVKPGDALFLPTPAGTVSFRVLAVIVDYTTDIGTVVIDTNTFRRHWGDTLVDSFSVRIQAGETVAAVREAIQHRFGAGRNLFVLSAADYKFEIRRELDRMFLFNHAINVITLAIGCLGIIIALFSAVLERRREIGTLRAVGMRKSQVAAMVLLEALLIGSAGGILGSAGGVISGWIILEGLFTAAYGSAATYSIPYGSVLWALLLSVGLSATASVIPALQAAKTNLVAALGSE